MQVKPQVCKEAQSCIKQYAPKELISLFGDGPRFQGCDCRKCPRTKLGPEADSYRIFWFYWPYDGIHEIGKSAKDRRADWEPLQVFLHPEMSDFFLVTTAHWKAVCWGMWDEYKLRFFNFWHTPMVEGLLRERLFQRMDKIYASLTKLGIVYFGTVRVLEKLSRFVRKIMRRKTHTVAFNPSSCLSEIPNINPREDPEEPSRSLESRRKEIKWEKIEEAIDRFRKFM